MFILEFLCKHWSHILLSSLINIGRIYIQISKHPAGRWPLSWVGLTPKKAFGVYLTPSTGHLECAIFSLQNGGKIKNWITNKTAIKRAKSSFYLSFRKKYYIINVSFMLLFYLLVIPFFYILNLSQTLFDKGWSKTWLLQRFYVHHLFLFDINFEHVSESINRFHSSAL